MVIPPGSEKGRFPPLHAYMFHNREKLRNFAIRIHRKPMKKSLGLVTEIKQQQKLTPLQVQFVRMLEMTGPEMEDEVQRALGEMPALEAVAPSSEETMHEATEDGGVFTESDRDMMRADFRSDDDVPDYLEPAQARESFASRDSYTYPASPRTAYDPDRYTDPVVADSGETLFESLSAQIAELPVSDEEARIALYIAGSLDDNGYMTRPVSAIADDLAINENIDTTEEQIRHCLQLVRSLEPAGVGASDLRDCLLLQLRRLPRSTESITAIEILDKHFSLFSKKHFDKIASALGISREQLQNALELISRLNPKPGSAIASSDFEDRSRHITPDFSVEPDANGTLILTMLNRIPELQVEASFANEGDLASGDERRLEEARAFVRRKRDDARNFIKLVTQRQETLFRVMSAILRIQHRFFLSENDEDIRPMVLRDIAALTGYDLSVISRATQGKYVATIRGIYPLKKFFNEKLRDDDNVTANRIIAEIKKAIESEDPEAPLSDREITARLSEAGFDIARRTVAKYRENLGFPVARLRKKR